ncbi:MAG: SpoIID/LytB domain-containing protein [Pyrinomonadaceae bacterium]|nr:SpoIID/LytB domain-containing protein [Pyrinomonadaceae bacterium]
MNFRNLLSLSILTLCFVSSSFPHFAEPEAAGFKLEREPLVRIGLLRNSSSALISTKDSALAVSIGGGNTRALSTNSLRVSSRSYRPPTYEYYRFEIKNIESNELAKEMAAQVGGKTGKKPAVFSSSGSTETWRIEFAEEMESRSEAEAFVAQMTETGIENVEIIPIKYTSPSDESIELSRQITANPKLLVRSLLLPNESNSVSRPGYVRKISSSKPIRRKNANIPINRSIREVTVSGRGTGASFSTLRPVTIGSVNSRGIIRLNGKRYRGKMEVFVNSKGRITVVNVVPMEQYLLGVVPAELSLPQLEAQKAQAVAARTYSVANRNGYGLEGFDMLPTVWSQVYKGVRIETRMGSRAVRETRGVVATYQGKPINAMYTSTCGGRTENSGNIYEFDEPYLRGVNCSLEGKLHFAPFLIKSEREPALIRNEANYEMVRLASKLAVNNYLMITKRFDDDYFEDPPAQTELKSWMNQLAIRFGKPFPVVDEDSSKPLKLARILHRLIYTPNAEENADTLMSEADVDYQLSFLDADEVPKQDRLMLAELIRDGWFSIYSDLTIKPNKKYSRGKILRLIDHFYSKKKWSLSFNSGTANPTEDGKLMIKMGRREKEITVNPNVFLFRQFGDAFYQVKETAVVGGEKVRYKTNALGEAVYLEVDPIAKTTVAERMSPFTTWRKNLSASAVRARLGRYVKGLGALIDVRVKNKGFSRRATELEIITTNGTHYLKGGKIRSALRLREQLFVMNKRYGSNGRVVRYNFVGRGWGHGIGMCQYGAYGFAKMGLKYEQIVRHYYSNIELTKAY